MDASEGQGSNWMLQRGPTKDKKKKQKKKKSFQAQLFIYPFVMVSPAEVVKARPPFNLF
jgi:hypothetical protein